MAVWDGLVNAGRSGAVDSRIRLLPKTVEPQVSGMPLCTDADERPARFLCWRDPRHAPRLRHVALPLRVLKLLQDALSRLGTEPTQMMRAERLNET